MERIYQYTLEGGRVDVGALGFDIPFTYNSLQDVVFERRKRNLGLLGDGGYSIRIGNYLLGSYIANGARGLIVCRLTDSGYLGQQQLLFMENGEQIEVKVMSPTKAGRYQLMIPWFKAIYHAQELWMQGIVEDVALRVSDQEVVNRFGLRGTSALERIEFLQELATQL